MDLPLEERLGEISLTFGSWRAHSDHPFLRPLVEELLQMVRLLLSEVTAQRERAKQAERTNFKLRAYADYEYVADAELEARVLAAEGVVVGLREQLSNERVQRTWAFEQLRAWWRGVPRDMSDPASAVAELDRVERSLARAALLVSPHTDGTAVVADTRPSIDGRPLTEEGQE